VDKKTVLMLRVTAQRLKPTLHIGKDGLSDMIVEELVKQMKKSKLVKVRVLNSYEGNRRDIGAHLAIRTSSVLIDVRGSTIVLAQDERGQR